MKHYTPKQVNEIKQQIRTGKPLPIIADDLAIEWDRPASAIYNKAKLLARSTRKINNTWVGPSKKARKKKVVGQVPRPAVIMNFDPMEGSLFSNYEKRVEEIMEDIKSKNSEEVVKEICEEIIENTVEREPAEIGIDVPVGNISFIGTPSRVVIYPDHVRYYYNNN